MRAEGMREQKPRVSKSLEVERDVWRVKKPQHTEMREVDW